jgi:hypothetical protein
VHSTKDLPGVLPPGFALGCVLERGDPRDALVMRAGSPRNLADLPPGCSIGTSALRRQSQILALRPDIAIRMMRGNIDTRLRKLDDGEVDAIILAAAGLRRIGLGARITLALDPAKYGAIFFRCTHEGLPVHVSNIPFSVFEFNESFSWGYRGTGPFNVAKNVINAFVPPESDGKPAREANTTYWGIRKQTFASHTADAVAEAFYEQMLVKIPAWGGYISAPRIKQWILAEVARRGGAERE